MAVEPRETTAKKTGAPPRSRARRRLDERAEERVCEAIRNWTGKPLTWEALTDALARSERGGWTRQTLAANQRIAESYDKQKAALRSGKAKPPRDPAIVVLQRDVKARDMEIARLQGILRQYEERFLTMIRNAAIRGIAREELERPMHSIDRKKI